MHPLVKKLTKHKDFQNKQFQSAFDIFGASLVGFAPFNVKTMESFFLQTNELVTVFVPETCHVYMIEKEIRILLNDKHLCIDDFLKNLYIIKAHNTFSGQHSNFFDRHFFISQVPYFVEFKLWCSII